MLHLFACLVFIVAARALSSEGSESRADALCELAQNVTEHHEALLELHYTEVGSRTFVHEDGFRTLEELESDAVLLEATRWHRRRELLWPRNALRSRKPKRVLTIVEVSVSSAGKNIERFLEFCALPENIEVQYHLVDAW